MCCTFHTLHDEKIGKDSFSLSEEEFKSSGDKWEPKFDSDSDGGQESSEEELDISVTLKRVEDI